MKKIALLFVLFISTLAASAASVEIKRAWLDDYGYENDVYGRYAHVGFVISNCRSQRCAVYVYMLDANGDLLKDSQGRIIFYRDYFTPSSNEAKFHDYRLFCKKANLHPRAYYLQIRIKDGDGNTIGKSSLLKL